MLVVLALFLFLQKDIPTLEGRAVRISDGDSFTLLTAGNKNFRIRIQGIDAPEKGQDYYQASKSALGQWLQNKTISCQVLGKDRYGRTIAVVSVDGGRDIGLEMVKSGLAWHFTRYSSDSTLAAAETKARAQALGLWKMKNPTPPWIYRKTKQQLRKKDTAGLLP